MKNIVKLIGKFNVATLMVVVFLYIACLVLVLIAINPKYSYYVEPSYEHNTGYSELSNSYQIVYKRILNNQKIEESYSIRTAINSRTSIDNKADLMLSIVKFQPELLQTNGQEYYLSEASNATTTWARTTSLGEGHEPKKYFGKVTYVDSNNTHQTKAFKEEMFETPKNLKDYTEGNAIYFGNVEFCYQVVANPDGDDQLVTMRLYTTTQKYFHIDLQTWLVTVDDKYLPFAGIYGYNSGSWSVANERVLKDLNVKAIACKFICYFEDEEYEVHNITNFGDMKTTFADIENIEASNIHAVSIKEVNKVIAYCAIGATIACIAVTVILCAVKVKRNKNKENIA